MPQVPKCLLRRTSDDVNQVWHGDHLNSYATDTDRNITAARWSYWTMLLPENRKISRDIPAGHAGHIPGCVPMSRRFELVCGAAIKRRISATRYRRIPSAKAKDRRLPLVLVVERARGGKGGPVQD